MYNATIIVDVSFGDVGKGRIVDYLSKTYDVIVRNGGGANAGHTIIVNDKKTVLRLIPSGILHSHTICILGHGMVIDPNVFHQEVIQLEAAGVGLNNRLILSNHAHVVLPEHIEIDKAKNGRLGTTNKGIGPCYESKARRDGLRIVDIENNSSFSEEVLKTIKRFSTKNVPHIINSHIKEGRNVMFEGAQGTLLDIDLGTYPYVTSSNAAAGGACTGSGVGPTAITSTIGITKAYVTRVGEGPFPTEITATQTCADTDASLIAAKHLQTLGKEFGAVTGRPRKVGWLDLPLLRYTAEVNNLSMLAITKLDILSGLDIIKVATHYAEPIDSHAALRNIVSYPDLDTLGNVTPIYKEFPGWKEDISNVRNFEDLPINAQNYINFIYNELDIPICLISVGAERDQMIDQMDIACDTYCANKFGLTITGIREVVNTYMQRKV
jgi:adenylosuccinate synthase